MADELIDVNSLIKNPSQSNEDVVDVNSLIKKKDGTNISGDIKSPLPSQGVNQPDFEKGLSYAQRGYTMPSEGTLAPQQRHAPAYKIVPGPAQEKQAREEEKAQAINNTLNVLIKERKLGHIKENDPYLQEEK